LIQEKPWQPKIEIVPRIINHGEQKDNAEVEGIFHIRNHGLSALIINRITSSCGCIILDYKQSIVKPRQNLAVKYKLSTHSRRGNLEATIVVRSNDTRNPVTTIPIMGYVKNDYYWDPPVLSFGKTFWDEQKALTLRLFPPVESAAKPIAIRVPDETMFHVGKIMSPANAMDPWMVKVLFKRANFIGDLHSEILIDMSEEPVRKLRIPLEIEIIGDVQVMPKSLYFGLVTAGSSYSRSVEIAPTKGHPLSISSIQNDAPDVMSLRTEVTTSGALVLTAQLKPRKNITQKQISVVVSRDSAIYPKIVVPVHFMVK
jgi:hypothetical protein